MDFRAGHFHLPTVGGRYRYGGFLLGRLRTCQCKGLLLCSSARCNPCFGEGFHCTLKIHAKEHAPVPRKIQLFCSSVFSMTQQKFTFGTIFHSRTGIICVSVRVNYRILFPTPRMSLRESTLHSLTESKTKIAINSGVSENKQSHISTSFTLNLPSSLTLNLDDCSYAFHELMLNALINPLFNQIKN